MRPEAILEITDRLTLPTAGVFTGASLYSALSSIASIKGHVHPLTVTEAFVEISVAMINALPATIGGVTLLMGCYLTYQRRKTKEARDHEYRMEQLRSRCSPCHRIAQEGDSKFALDPRSAKPSEDTVDIP